MNQRRTMPDSWKSLTKRKQKTVKPIFKGKHAKMLHAHQPARNVYQKNQVKFLSIYV